jgi:hypothetical protein
MPVSKSRRPKARTTRTARRSAAPRAPRGEPFDIELPTVVRRGNATDAELAELVAALEATGTAYVITP